MRTEYWLVKAHLALVLTVKGTELSKAMDKAFARVLLRGEIANQKPRS